MRTLRKVLLATVATVIAGFALAQAIKCPIDNSNMAWTGNTKFEMGKTLAEYKCIHGHTTWIVK